MAEMIHVAEWKMKRGEWRARNLALIRSNPDVLVRTASAEAFSAVDDDRRPIDLLSRLAGVGPATASAVLAARAPDRFPFLDEDVAEAVPGLGPCRFTLPYYIRYAQALRDRARQLGRPWTAQEVGLALWAVRGGKAARR